ncbi:MAG: nucleotidyl transferase AbiEii/AbiGii toxin family protein [Terriglobales bacterium]
MNARNTGASARQRLLNQARATGRPFQELLQYFAMERFLYRLAQSPYAERFVLKGALLLTAWRAPQSRPTVDIDLAGRMSNAPEAVRAAIREIIAVPVVDDGVRFSPSTVETRKIREDAEYEGVRATFRAELAGARLPMQIDIGFGDVIFPEPGTIHYPLLLEFPAPVLRAYPRETVVAEKLHAIVFLQLLNSRVKDYFDLWLLARMYSFDGPMLVEAIRATLRHRDTTIDPAPAGLSAAYAEQPARAAQWRAFLRTNRIAFAPATLHEVVAHVAAFSLPVLNASVGGGPFATVWQDGAWTGTAS